MPSVCVLSWNMTQRSVVGPLFPLGAMLATPGAIARMDTEGIDPSALLARHTRGDWGTLSAEDAALNDLAAVTGGRILSNFGRDGERIWVITESDRSATTFLRPEDC